MRLVFLFLALLGAAPSFSQTEWGCTDPAANNYDPAATADNGTCCYDGVWYVVNASEACYFSFYNDQLGYLGAAEFPSQAGLCIPDVCTSVNVQNYMGVGTFTWSVSDNQGNILLQGQNMPPSTSHCKVWKPV